jgi:ketosteroid isomerase-like protein
LGEAADVIRAAFQRANAGDPNGLAALCDETVEFHDVPEIPGRASGAEVAWRFWTVWRVRDGLITYHHGYSQREDAVADLGQT